MFSPSSSTPFYSFAQYRPHVSRASSDLAKRAQSIVVGTKNDDTIVVSGESVRVVDWLAGIVAQYVADDPDCILRECLGPTVVLVPMPRSAPLSGGALWPARRICEAFVQRELGSRVWCAMERAEAVPKSHLAKSTDERPKAETHYRTCAFQQEDLGIDSIGRVTLVDDVITKGATMVGVGERLREKLPGSDLKRFALFRSMFEGDLQRFASPFKGSITYYPRSGKTFREPETTHPELEF